MSLTNAMEGVIPLSIYTVLKGEHAEVNTLFKTLRASPDALDGTRKTIFEKLRRELLSHAKAEETTVYAPAAQKIPKDDVDEAKKEHEEMERLLISLSNSDVQSSAWESELKTLMEAVQHHVKEEEEEMFKKMQQVFSDEEAKDMAKNFREAKNRALESMK